MFEVMILKMLFYRMNKLFDKISRECDMAHQLAFVTVWLDVHS